jgi:hypothetical protein
MMRRYLVWFALTVSAVLLPTVYLSYVFGPIDGDLTRTGGYSERDFGWNSTQPVVDVSANARLIADPDVLVLGDSFSVRNIWQSVLAAGSGRKIQSFHYNQAGCLANWIDYAGNHPTAKLIFIEVIERELLKRFTSQPACKSEYPIPLEGPAGKTAARRTTWPPEWHIYYALRVAMNTLEMALKPNAGIRSNVVAVRGSVINAPLKPDCASFSNRRADRLLYLALDEDKLQWKRDDQARAVANIRNIQKTLLEHGKELVVVIVPDKLSVYERCLQDDRGGGATSKASFTDILIAAGIDSPDLFTTFRANSSRIVDLYYPNNTHLSESGYVLMADTLRQFIVRQSPGSNGGH